MGEYFDSTSENRTLNNIARHQYRTLTQSEKEHMANIKDKGLSFIEYCDRLGSTRELEYAKAKMEEAIFWAVKHITA